MKIVDKIFSEQQKKRKKKKSKAKQMFYKTLIKYI